MLAKRAKSRRAEPSKAAPVSKSVPRYVVMDVEIARGVQEVGGWNDPANVRKTGLAVAVVFTSWTGQISIFLENQVRDLAKTLRQAPLIVGYNLDRFDLEVLRGYPGVALKNVETLDLMALIQSASQRRTTLDELAEASFGVAPGPTGLELIEHWKRGNVRAVIEACVNDVLIMDRLFQLLANGREVLVPTGLGKSEAVAVRLNRSNGAS